MDFVDREREEVRRSAVEASRRTEPIVASVASLQRYLDPPGNTPFPLEYSFHLLNKSIRKQEAVTVLDYGCGAGENLIPIARTGADAVGLDISPDLIELARKAADAYDVRARFVVGSAYDTGLPAKSIDVVFAIAVLHHLDLEAARTELLRILRPDGVVIIQEPVRDSKWMGRLRSLLPHSEEVSAFEKPLTRTQLGDFSRGFTCDSVRRFRLPFVAVAEHLSPRQIDFSYSLDARLLQSFESLQHFATIEVRRLTTALA